ncbi:DNA glycosylase [Coniophora puteana RWD-64-598 SS2]|uniref:DNA glycosylase n=1 Tax=Coniophora puteana (strain RWD-64-598) TaxID=741705 RepID=R7SFC4_CONPW|nr:DNA glycosylase [Coniophora puteana RWD-64-598 SS2]EIW74447.1 DNA glycosylase [Coniophora puteana RWD-64-598 SS2]
MVISDLTVKTKHTQLEPESLRSKCKKGSAGSNHVSSVSVDVRPTPVKTLVRNGVPRILAWIIWKHGIRRPWSRLIRGNLWAPNPKKLSEHRAVLRLLAPWRLLLLAMRSGQANVDTIAITRRSTRTITRVNYATLGGRRIPETKTTTVKRERVTRLVGKSFPPHNSLGQDSTLESNVSAVTQSRAVSSKKRKVTGTPQRQHGEPLSKKAKRLVASPETYPQLRPLGDNVKEGLDVIFCGVNPGKKSAQVGHYYANPRNYFWRCLHRSGFTSRQLAPSEDRTLPGDFNLGLACQLSKAEMRAGVVPFLRKVARLHPRVIAIVGTQTWKETLLPELERLTGQRSKDVRKAGLQPFKLVSQIVSADESGELGDNATLIYVVLSTSPAATLTSLKDKVASFAELKALVESRVSEVDTIPMVEVCLDSI